MKGRGGMGSHKHGVSGYAPRSPGYKQQRTREANALADAERAKKQPGKTYASVAEALQSERSRKDGRST
jgi:hypothetical protein